MNGRDELVSSVSLFVIPKWQSALRDPPFEACVTQIIEHTNRMVGILAPDVTLDHLRDFVGA